MPINEEKLKKSLNNQEQKTKSGKNNVTVSKKDTSIYDELLVATRENQRLLKKLVRHQHWATFFSFLKILIFIVPLIAAYLYLPSLLDKVMSNYQSIMGTVDDLKSTTQGLEAIKGVDLGDQLKQLEGLFK